MGDAITDSEYVKAKKYADHKLKIIIEQEGDADGERCKPYYLAQLISETVRANRFSVTTVTHIRALQELFDCADKMFAMGKKEMPVS